MTVLIVDDEVYMTDYIKKLVDWEQYGFDKVLTAGGSSLARDLLLEHKPELLITDIKMPRMSGLELAGMLAKERMSTKVIIMSGYSEFEYAQQALRHGVVEYLVKPVLKSNLTEALDREFGKVVRERRCECVGNSNNADDRQAVIFEVKTYVYENFDKCLSLEALGEVVHLHPAYLSKIFKEITGENLSGYIADIRMQKAAELLEQTDLRVHEVMETVGYQKSQYFAKLFKEKFGVTPKEYRRGTRGI